MSQLDAFTDRDRAGHFLVWHKAPDMEPGEARRITDAGLCFRTYGTAEQAGEISVARSGGTFNIRDVGPGWFKDGPLRKVAA